MRNLGPVMEELLGGIEIRSQEDLRALGSVVAFARLRFRYDRQVTILALYAMEAALRGCDWRDLPPAVKADLRAAAAARPV